MSMWCYRSWSSVRREVLKMPNAPRMCVHARVRACVRACVRARVLSVRAGGHTRTSNTHDGIVLREEVRCLLRVFRVVFLQTNVTQRGQQPRPAIHMCEGVCSHACKHASAWARIVSSSVLFSQQLQQATARHAIASATTRCYQEGCACECASGRAGVWAGVCRHLHSSCSPRDGQKLRSERRRLFKWTCVDVLLEPFKLAQLLCKLCDRAFGCSITLAARGEGCRGDGEGVGGGSDVSLK
jgi:hypothetical protein